MNKVFWSFFGWRIGLFFIAILATVIIPASHPLFPYKDMVLEPTRLPSWIWGFGNFDGVHYLRIALMGYKESQFSQAFFPLYPLVMRSISSCCNLYPAGLLLSNISFLTGLIILYKLFLFDFDKKTSFLSIILLLIFPTAFYFGSLYSESFLFLFSVLTFFFLRKKQFLLAGLFIGLASATRLVGVFLLLPYTYEMFFFFKKTQTILLKNKSLMILGVLLGLSGILGYILYLYINFHNPLIFLTSPFSFNTGRNGWFVLLPQVFYRYLKIFLSVPILSWSFFNAFLEVLFTFFALFLLVYSFKKTNKGYWLFVLFSTLLPTLTGTLTSMPRYVLTTFILFPVFIKLFGRFTYPVFVVLALIESLLTALFIRGYWIA